MPHRYKFNHISPCLKPAVLNSAAIIGFDFEPDQKLKLEALGVEVLTLAQVFERRELIDSQHIAVCADLSPETRERLKRRVKSAGNIVFSHNKESVAEMIFLRLSHKEKAYVPDKL